jgi:hypothetical protein
MTANKRAEVEEAVQKRYAAGVSLERLQKEYGLTRYVIRGIITRGGGEIRGRGRPLNRVAAEPVLTNKLKELEKVLGEPVNPDVLLTIVSYALRHNDGRTFRKIDRRYNYDGALSAFRRDHLESSYYFMGRLWRYAYRAVAKKKIQYSDYGIAREDARLVISVLNAEEKTIRALLASDSKEGIAARKAGVTPAKERILHWLSEAGEYVHLPNEDCVHRVVQDCIKTMNTIVNTKLRFVYQYDPAFDKSDLVSYLTVIAYRVAIKYDWEMKDGAFDYTKCLNFTNRSLWNAANLIIKERGDGGVHSRLTTIDTEERVYQVTTISMDTPQDDEWLSIESKLGEDADRSIEVKSLISSITDKRLQAFLRLEDEEVPGFKEFVLKESGKDENELYAADYNKWRELAQRFSGILTKADRADIKRPIRIGLDMWDEAKAKRV